MYKKRGSLRLKKKNKEVIGPSQNTLKVPNTKKCQELQKRCLKTLKNRINIGNVIKRKDWGERAR